MCALAPSFLGWAFLLFVSLVRSGKGTVALSQQEPSVWWEYTQGTENSDPRSFLQIPPAGEFDGGDAATSHFGVFSGHWHEFTGVVRSQFYSGNSTRIFQSISTGVHERLKQLDREHSLGLCVVQRRRLDPGGHLRAIFTVGP